jgi:hypothetical protein
MLKLIFLIAVLISPDGEQYQEAVGNFPTTEQCEAAKRAWPQSVHEAKGFHYFAICTPSQPIGSVGV